MNRSTWLASLLVLVAAPALPAQTTLQRKLDGTVFIEVKHSTKQNIRVLGTNQDQDTTIRFLFKVQPAKGAGKDAVFDVTIEDCSDKGSKNGVADEDNTLKGFRDQKFQLTLGEDNKTLAIKASKDLTEAVFGEEAREGTEAEQALVADLAATILRVHLLDAFTPLPGKPVNAGDKWKNSTAITLQSFVRMDVDREYVLRARKPGDPAGLETIAWTSTFDIKPVGKQGGLPFTIKDVKQNKPGTYEGTVQWDTAAGRPKLVESQQSYDLEFTMEIDGKTIKGSGTGKDNFTIRFFDRNPEQK